MVRLTEAKTLYENLDGIQLPDLEAGDPGQSSTSELHATFDDCKNTLSKRITDATTATEVEEHEFLKGADHLGFFRVCMAYTTVICLRKLRYCIEKFPIFCSALPALWRSARGAHATDSQRVSLISPSLCFFRVSPLAASSTFCSSKRMPALRWRGCGGSAWRGHRGLHLGGGHCGDRHLACGHLAQRAKEEHAGLPGCSGGGGPVHRMRGLARIMVVT